MTETNPAAPVSALPLSTIRAQQNFPLAIAAGLGASLAGAIAWAIVTVVTEMKLGLMAVAIGYIVGQAIRATGKGVDQQFGILGAACALFGCVVGNVLSAVAFYAKVKGLGFGDVMQILDFDFVTRVTTATAQPMDLLFYGIAIYEGYRFSFRYKATAPKPAAPKATAPK
jgi:hypothetical protein